MESVSRNSNRKLAIVVLVLCLIVGALILYIIVSGISTTEENAAGQADSFGKMEEIGTPGPVYDIPVPTENH